MSHSIIAKKWFDAFNRQSVADLLDLYDDNAEHFSPRLLKMHPETNGLIKGKSAMHDWWQGAFDRMPSLRYKIVELKEEGEKIYMKYIRSVDGENDSLINEMLQIDKGKIIFSKVL